jgi:hypothetical protein
MRRDDEAPDDASNQIAVNVLKLMRQLANLTFASVLIGTVLFPTVSSRASQAEDDRWGWGYCAPPYPPACVASPGKGPDARSTCEQDTEIYIASVFKYRECLSKEMERAVLEANHALQRLKCPTDDRFCYDLQRKGQKPETR